jgi:hypothetical protein
MSDFLKAVTKRPSEIVDVEGYEVEVRGLNIGEQNRLRNAANGDAEALGLAILCACCFLDGKRAFTEETVQSVMPRIAEQLSAAIKRVNGSPPGNSGATDADDSASA